MFLEEMFSKGFLLPALIDCKTQQVSEEESGSPTRGRDTETTHRNITPPPSFWYGTELMGGEANRKV